MSTRIKQRAVIGFLTAEKVTPTEIHRRLKKVYGDDAVDRSTVNRWVIKFRACEPGKTRIVDEPRSGRPITATDDKHRKLVDDFIQNDRRITQKRIANHIGISKERVGFIIEQLGYRKLCARWVPRRFSTTRGNGKFFSVYIQTLKHPSDIEFVVLEAVWSQ